MAEEILIEPALTVRELLAQSRAAHSEYRGLTAARVAKDVRLLALARARDLRVQADTADPAHLDPAWALDKAPHLELMIFYDQQLAGLDAQQAPAKG